MITETELAAIEERSLSENGKLETCLCDIPRLIAEVRELRAIVDRLPKTADGVPIYDGMDLHPSPCDFPIVECHAKTDAYWVTRDGQHVIDDPQKFYSTREAALAGKGGE
jgi:hypothetical protein